MCAGTGPTCAQDHLGFRVKGFRDHVVTWSPFDALLLSGGESMGCRCWNYLTEVHAFSNLKGNNGTNPQPKTP